MRFFRWWCMAMNSEKYCMSIDKHEWNEWKERRNVSPQYPMDQTIKIIYLLLDSKQQSDFSSVVGFLSFECVCDSVWCSFLYMCECFVAIRTSKGFNNIHLIQNNSVILSSFFPVWIFSEVQWKRRVVSTQQETLHWWAALLAVLRN